MEQTEDPATHRMTPACVRANQFAATVAGYRAHAIADGLPFRCFPTMRESATCKYPWFLPKSADECQAISPIYA